MNQRLAKTSLLGVDSELVSEDVAKFPRQLSIARIPSASMLTVNHLSVDLARILGARITETKTKRTIGRTP